MKELYISPEMEIVAFAPIEHLAGLVTPGFNGYSGNGGLTGGESDSDFTQPVDPEEGL